MPKSVAVPLAMLIIVAMIVLNNFTEINTLATFVGIVLICVLLLTSEGGGLPRDPDISPARMMSGMVLVIFLLAIGGAILFNANERGKWAAEFSKPNPYYTRK